MKTDRALSAKIKQKEQKFSKKTKIEYNIFLNLIADIIENGIHRNSKADEMFLLEARPLRKVAY